MGLKKLAEKIADYKDRLEHGNASQIKPAHVEKTLQKLRKKRAELEAEIAVATGQDKRTRLQRKLDLAAQQIDRAEHLLAEIS